LAVRVSRFLFGTLTVLGIGLVLYIVFAGVRLEIENQSGLEIKNIRVDYGRESLLVASLHDKEVFKKLLGKIGEGATFDVGWEEDSGMNRKSHFGVYFDGLTGYETIRIRFLPGEGKSELLYEGRTFHPDEHLTNRSSTQALGTRLQS
jgi:hypothetical protein